MSAGTEIGPLWRQEQRPIILRLEEHQKAALVGAVRSERDVLVDLLNEPVVALSSAENLAAASHRIVLLNDVLVQLGVRAPD